ncbi:ArsR/SmtB family transcription factor [Pseudonocardia sp. TRM90224]|uniref:ArsR/SmtB family transcription factor n=1 Tax=Pseudonocardia sp. TRM90224 TaxID=2812678 RepID=UPI001E3C6A72|nr:helix-turn-helix domain-containing protein [Pseudonocardia sp. TRM90224]
MTDHEGGGVAVIEDAATAAVAIDPVRARLLAALREPGSAASLAAGLGMSRQNTNHHLRALERHGLVELVEERRKGNMIERVVRATAGSYVISPLSWAMVAPDPARQPDKLSAQWLLAVAARLLQDVGRLITKAGRRRIATFAIDGEIRFASAADRAEFVGALGESVRELVARFHVPDEPGGRTHRIVVALHPTVTEEDE